MKSFFTNILYITRNLYFGKLVTKESFFANTRYPIRYSYACKSIVGESFFINNSYPIRYITFLSLQPWYLQPIITQYFIDNKSEIWLLFLIAHSKR